MTSEEGSGAAPAAGGGSACERYGEPIGAAELASPAAERNKEPILDVLRRVLPAAGVVLEIASGTGQHAVHFARALPQLIWQPTDLDGELLDAIRRRVAAHAFANVRAPTPLDVARRPWPVTRADALLCINMVHIAPWSAAEALFEGSGIVLARGAPLILYGPFKRGERHTAPSNEAFDRALRARDPAWGVRDLDEVTALAASHGFALDELVEMPANNLIVVFRKE